MEIKHGEEIAEQSLHALENLASEYSCIEGCCYYAHITVDSEREHLKTMNKLFKTEGSLLLILIKGKLRIEYNSESFTVDDPSFITFAHGSLVKMEPVDSPQIEAYLIAYTASFMQDINISFTSISPSILIGHGKPTLSLREREIPMVLRYLSLMHNVMTDTYNTLINRHIISSISSAFFYHCMLLLYKRLENKGDENLGPRRSSYVHDFMRLVHVYYTKERSVGFYASQLYISPKYLSLLVKEATGRSAACWIDHFVISEAKNLLRYSGKNVQQVAYALNFSNQSSFGKYFKHLTGMSPTEYQKQ